VPRILRADAVHSQCSMDQELSHSRISRRDTRPHAVDLMETGRRVMAATDTLNDTDPGWAVAPSAAALVASRARAMGPSATHCGRTLPGPSGSGSMSSLPDNDPSEVSTNSQSLLLSGLHSFPAVPVCC
jgi:hypothetical protein